MNKMRTLRPLNVSRTTAILFGKVVSKDSSIVGVGFCIKEGDTGDPVVGVDPIAGVIGGDFPVDKYASTIMDLKPDTNYRYRAVSADIGLFYTITPVITGLSIIADDRGLAMGDTVIPGVYTAATKHLLVQGVWDLDFSVSGTFTYLVPAEMGGGDGQSITFVVDTTKLPTTDWAGDITVNKAEIQVFYGATQGFKTKI